jgi:alkanesulfonate monooxygenase SsuD/methylene tetrahydromethanopterin reductase-like flavin-dependent oxidoreductase (luciferase family)
MDLGYSLTSAYPLDQPTGDAVNELLSAVETAHDAGFDYVQAGDHHVMDDTNYFQNVPVLGRLTSIFDRVAGLFIVPLYDPILLGEYCGTLDALSDEFELWCAVGWRSEEFDAFDVPRRERAPRLEENLSILEAVWEDNDVDYSGTYRSIQDISINPKASPRRTVIGGIAEPAIERAGRLGDGWVASPVESPEDLKRKREWFEAGGGGDILVRRDALVLEDGSEAQKLATDRLESGYRGWDTDAPILAGGVEDIVEDLWTLADHGVKDVVVRPMEDEYAEETLRVLGEARDRAF